MFYEIFKHCKPKLWNKLLVFFMLGYISITVLGVILRILMVSEVIHSAGLCQYCHCLHICVKCIWIKIKLGPCIKQNKLLLTCTGTILNWKSNVRVGLWNWMLTDNLQCFVFVSRLKKSVTKLQVYMILFTCFPTFLCHFV